MSNHPAEQIQDLQFFGEYGGVNPSISDSSTYTFMTAKSMSDTFEGNTDGCFLYSRHTSPSNLYLSSALAKMENTEDATVFASGMGAITSTVLQICQQGDHIVASRTIYGGTYAFLKNVLPKFGIETTFVDFTNCEAIKKAVAPNTKMLYGESVSNPLLGIIDFKAVSEIAQQNQAQFVVDNTFSPLMFQPANFGADVVIHSLTKFINGSSDTVAGAVCASSEFVENLKDVNTGLAMLLGQTLDSWRAASILKNLRTLPIRMQKHSQNAQYLAEQFEALGYKVSYPGLKSHPQHNIISNYLFPDIGYGGIMTIDFETLEKANAIMEMMQHQNLGYLAVSLGFYKTLFSASGTSTSSEISEEEQQEMGLSEGLVRFSIGLDYDIKVTFKQMKKAIELVERDKQSSSVKF
ncbi:aminotransferase class I/II-fold pyridoxal phosphate-dependent enzyme [Flavobacterium sp. CS20]|uniref:aminotransferase class I/II-fold pyridoxal phosphate-dependent enzyme n=1 Tax=Flavobacterium sp. CS20 TaxID=2775246 RepID=UPI001B3A76BE|nr:aminotransferase class I/II-fold pyridoxal phosphate-dependent enzyme [Flavobacterium sp. CS20]QTY27400.1 aminotransferase class I/II-fold pyridoxal phosphate-dependent enzyme [Flavobacterium sp. CS20]